MWGVCRRSELPPELEEACKRLKSEEFGHEMYFNAPCYEVKGYIKSLYPHSYERNFFRTGDSDYDIIIPIDENLQVHYRLREVRKLNGCLGTAHVEPSDPVWHAICGTADKLLKENKPEVCRVVYNVDKEILQLFSEEY